MALSTPRFTPIRADANYNNRNSLPMATATTIFTGALVCLNSGGYLVNGSATTGLKAVGILGDQPFEVPSTSIVNSGGNGAKLAEVQGTPIQAKLANSSGDPVVLADVGSVCYIEDNQTVCHTGTGKSQAGQVMGVEDSTSPTGPGVWVLIGGAAIANAGAQGATGTQGPQGPQGTQGPQGA